ncbi:hypothetical protein [Streptomyces luteireticuli]|uniref:hypothetical protein n=1 Tax=Streptomyces luteireticuli TaxID=173858 RepID=UPI003558D711
MFMDEVEPSDGPKACIPNAALQDMTTRQFAVFAYLPVCMAEGEEGTPEGFAETADWGDEIGDIKEIFDEVHASGWLQCRGCSACPRGDLCTRTVTEDTSAR